MHRPHPTDVETFDVQMTEVVEVETEVEVCTNDHTKLNNRDLPDQHPISAITGLEEALAKAGGEVDPDEIARLVEEYLAANPPAGTGEAGKDGEDGKDGFSPTVTVAAISGGYRIEITDVNGTQTVDILHGAAGKDGIDGTTPVKGEDYFTDEDVAEIAQKAAELVDVGQVDIDTLEAEKVVFTEDLMTTTAIGNIKLTNGQATIPVAGKNLVEAWNTIFVQEKNPATTQPSVTITSSQAKAYEVGETVSPSYSAKLNPGSYTYGPDTGVTATSWEVTDSTGNTSDQAAGTFADLTVTDDMSYKITAKATHGDGTIPVTNLGNEYAAGQIKAGSKSASTSIAITGYRNSFYGTVTEKGDITSDVIRGLSGVSNGNLADGDTFDVPIPVGAMRVLIAYPATLSDVDSIKDVNGLNAEISSGFVPHTVAVEGANGYDAINYKVYSMDFGAANDAANTFKVII